MIRRLSLVAAAFALAATLAASRAAADGDPASDILFTDNVFLSLEVPTQSQQGRELEALATAAKQARYPIKIVVVAKRSDLGTAAPLFGRAQAYADFLGQEIRFGYRGTLVVVMGGPPGGVGVYGPAKVPAVDTVIQSIAVPPHPSVQALAQTAATAVRRVAAAAGHPLPKVHVGSGGGDSGSTTRDRVIIGVAALVLATLLAFFWPRRRRRAVKPS